MGRTRKFSAAKSSSQQRHIINTLLQTVPDYIRKVHCDTTPKTTPFSCAVRTCKNKFNAYDEESPIKYHKFPAESNSTLQETWRTVCRISKRKDISACMVCSDHFTLDDYVRNYKEEFSNPSFKRKLKSNAVPNKLLPSNDTPEHDSDSSDSFENITEIELDKLQYDSESKNSIQCSLPEAIQAELNEREELELLLKKTTENNINSQIGLERFKKVMKIKFLEYKKAQKLHFQELKSRGRDFDILRKVFSSAQIKKLQGKRKVYWSEDDLAMAFSLRHMGGKECYLYLKNTLNWPLPALSCVQKWATSID